MQCLASALGQTEKKSVRANVRYALKLGHRLMQSARLAKQDVDGRVKPGHDEHKSKKARPGGDRAGPWCPVAIAPRNDEFDQQKCLTGKSLRVFRNGLSSPFCKNTSLIA